MSSVRPAAGELVGARSSWTGHWRTRRRPLLPEWPFPGAILCMPFGNVLSVGTQLGNRAERRGRPPCLRPTGLTLTDVCGRRPIARPPILLTCLPRELHPPDIGRRTDLPDTPPHGPTSPQIDLPTGRPLRRSTSPRADRFADRPPHGPTAPPPSCKRQARTICHALYANRKLASAEGRARGRPLRLVRARLGTSPRGGGVGSPRSRRWCWCFPGRWPGSTPS